MTPPPRRTSSGPARRRGGPTRTVLSVEAIHAAAIDVLDHLGPAGLTVRGLAAELGGGVGSIYWHVDGKEELLDGAADTLIGRALEQIAAVRDGRDDAASLRLPPTSLAGATGVRGARARAIEQASDQLWLICLALFEQMRQHPWLAPHLLRDTEVRRHGMRLWDEVGQQLAAMGLPPRAQLDGASSLMAFVSGMGAETAAHGARADEPERAAARDELLAQWSATDPDELPFVHAMLPLLAEHDDVEQFRAGLELLLVGLRHQASAS